MRKNEEVEEKWMRFKEEFEKREGAKRKRKLPIQDDLPTPPTQKMKKIKTVHSEAAPPENNLLALEFFPEGLRVQDNMLALEYFPDKDTRKVMEVSADSGGIETKVQKERIDPKPRTTIVKWKGRNKVPSSMKVINLREHFNLISSPKRKIINSEDDYNLSPAKKSTFRGFKNEASSKSEFKTEESENSNLD